MTISPERPLSRRRVGSALGTLAFAASTLLPATSAHAAEKAKQLVRANVTDAVTFSVYLPLQNKAGLEALLAAQQNPKSPSYRKWLTPAEFNKRFGPSAATVAAVRKELEAAGMIVTTPHSREFKVSGPAAMAERLLNTSLQKGVYSNGRVAMVASTTPTLPSAMRSADAKVLGLSGMIRMQSHARKTQLSLKGSTPNNRYGAAGIYWFDDLKQAYKFPSYKSLTGKGAVIGILMDGGYNQADMDLYFGHEKLGSPSYRQVNVDGGAAYDPSGGDSIEAALDLQQSGGMAPGAQVVLYSIPDLSEANIVDGLFSIDETDAADVVSMSFGAAEVYYTPAWNNGEDRTYVLQIDHDLFQQGNAQGITFVASSGDGGAVPAFPPNCWSTSTPGDCGQLVRSAESPASDPAVTGVGGTNLVTTYRPGDLDSAYLLEREYFDPRGQAYLTSDIYATNSIWGSGGGSSVLWTKPDFQNLVSTGDSRMRTVPDLSLHMGGCPEGAELPCRPEDSADMLAIGGAFTGVIGTSASAPDFAGLTALTVQEFGTRLGNLNNYIYTLAAAQASGALPFKVYNQGIAGDNGYYKGTSKGYNRVVGNGTVNGVDFLLAPTMPVAGIPQTSSNP